MPSNNLPSGNHYISVADAAEMTQRYRANLATILNNNYVSSAILPFCETFNKEAFAAFMANTDCVAIRIYYGMDENLKVHAILVGVNEEDEDMLPLQNLNPEDDPLVREDATRCPPACPPSSDLNQDNGLI